MQQDEAGALARLKQAFSVLAPRVAQHGGRVFRFMGDGALAEFASAVAAVR
jgi:class 3 adenylate cyclase